MDELQVNPYELLGVEVTATTQEVKRAYYRLALFLHPDRGGAHEDMLILQKAYQSILGITGEETRGYPPMQRILEDVLNLDREQVLEQVRTCIQEQFPKIPLDDLSFLKHITTIVVYEYTRLSVAGDEIDVSQKSIAEIIQETLQRYSEQPGSLEWLTSMDAGQEQLTAADFEQRSLVVDLVQLRAIVEAFLTPQEDWLRTACDPEYLTKVIAEEYQRTFAFVVRAPVELAVFSHEFLANHIKSLEQAKKEVAEANAKASASTSSDLILFETPFSGSSLLRQGGTAIEEAYRPRLHAGGMTEPEQEVPMDEATLSSELDKLLKLRSEVAVATDKTKEIKLQWSWAHT